MNEEYDDLVDEFASLDEALKARTESKRSQMDVATVKPPKP